METVKEKLANTLTEFSQSASDAINIEASQFEELEKDYQDYMLDDKGEEFVLELTEQMCSESLNPKLYSYWLIIKDHLAENRLSLIRSRQIENEAIAARNKLGEETLDYLKTITRGTDADTPDWDDALNCCHLD